MRRTYYDVTLAVKPGWTLPAWVRTEGNSVTGLAGADIPAPSRWDEPPHREFANLAIDAKTVKKFMLAYGPLVADLSEIPEPGELFKLHTMLAGYMQERLRDAWEDQDSRALWFPRGAEELERFDMPLFWKGRVPELRPAGVWTYMSILLTRDIQEKRARTCLNPSCPARYFIADRKDQRFCEHACANVVSQRNFRKRNKKRRK